MPEVLPVQPPVFFPGISEELSKCRTCSLTSSGSVSPRVSIDPHSLDSEQNISGKHRYSASKSSHISRCSVSRRRWTSRDRCRNCSTSAALESRFSIFRSIVPVTEGISRGAGCTQLKFVLKYPRLGILEKNLSLAMVQPHPTRPWHPPTSGVSSGIQSRWHLYTPAGHRVYYFEWPTPGPDLWYICGHWKLPFV